MNNVTSFFTLVLLVHDVSGEPNDFLTGLHFENVSFLEKPKEDWL